MRENNDFTKKEKEMRESLVISEGMVINLFVNVSEFGRIIYKYFGVFLNL